MKPKEIFDDLEQIDWNSVGIVAFDKIDKK